MLGDHLFTHLRTHDNTDDVSNFFNWKDNELTEIDLDCIDVGSNVGPKFGSANCVTVIDNRVHARVKSDTVKLASFQDDDNMELDNVCNSYISDLGITTICAIAALYSGLDFSEDSITTDIIQTIINSNTSQAITPAEQALGKFTRLKLKNMNI